MPWTLNLFCYLFFAALGGVNQPAKIVPAKDLHPFHVSVIEINHNVSAKTLEVSCKIFTDDLESTLADKFKTKVDLTNPPKKELMDTLIKRYMQIHFAMQVGGKNVNYNYLGYEIDKEAVFCYVEAEGVATMNQLNVTSSVLYDKYDDQINIIHAITPAGRKSLRINNPETKAVFTW
jgi:hypothetical protein